MSSLTSLTWSRVPAPVICIPAYERFPLQSVGSGKRLSVHISIVRKTSWSLFLMATGLWAESDSFLCCIFSPISSDFNRSVFFFFFLYLLGINVPEDVIIWRKMQQREKKRLNPLSAFNMHQICRSYISHCTSQCVKDALIHLLLSQIFNPPSEEILPSGT